jgi:hypothetical protein
MRRNFLSEQSNRDPRSSGVLGDAEISNFNPNHSGRRDTRGSHYNMNRPEFQDDEDFEDQYDMYGG